MACAFCLFCWVLLMPTDGEAEAERWRRCPGSVPRETRQAVCPGSVAEFALLTTVLPALSIMLAISSFINALFGQLGLLMYSVNSFSTKIKSFFRSNFTVNFRLSTLTWVIGSCPRCFQDMRQSVGWLSANQEEALASGTAVLKPQELLASPVPKLHSPLLAGRTGGLFWAEVAASPGYSLASRAQVHPGMPVMSLASSAADRPATFEIDMVRGGTEVRRQAW